jgi:Asp-tRNA(Asn)/Glu-tRNA(Gln) amidotransferase B subunit
VMRATQGKADPNRATQALKEHLRKTGE